MWSLFERVHSVTYFAPQARAAYEAAGLRGYWRGYFAGRAAPLGAVGPGPVAAMFFGFRRSMVERAIPDVWQRLAPPGVLRARLDGAREALAEAVGTTVPAEVVGEAAELLRAAADGADLAGRPLAAANGDLRWPEHPLEVLWQAATLLREHRGDGHVATLVAAGLDGVESLAWRAAVDLDRQLLQPNRGWPDDEWDAAVHRLVERGWLDADGSPTPAARTARDGIERTTDELAAGPWRRLGADRTARLAGLLRPIAAAAAKHLPQPNPIGLPPL
ncbi:MAG TPA: hypothetical protein VHN18_02835 [Micromonosporaceae bacterium]|nr:hypothetical protein [Micromonosporaceae bacterium]